MSGENAPREKVHLWKGRAVDTMSLDECRRALKFLIEQHHQQYADRQVERTLDRHLHPPRHMHGLWCDLWGCDK